MIKKLFILSLLIVASTMVANAQIVTSTSSLVRSIQNAKTISYDQPSANLISTSIGLPWEIISYTRTIAINTNGNNISTLFNYGGGFNYNKNYDRSCTALVATIGAGWRFHYSDTRSLDCTLGGSIGPAITLNNSDKHLNVRVNYNINKFVVGLCFVPVMHFGWDMDDPVGSLTIGYRF